MPAVLWTALAGGVLVKGPLIFMFVALTAITLSILDKSWRWIWTLRPLAGLAWPDLANSVRVLATRLRANLLEQLILSVDLKRTHQIDLAFIHILHSLYAVRGGIQRSEAAPMFLPSMATPRTMR